MEAIHYDAAATSAGSGTPGDPYRSLSSGGAGADREYILRGTFTVLDSEVIFPDGKLDYANVTVRAWDPANRPILSGLRTVPAIGGWTFEASTGTYWTSVTRGGIALRNGRPLKVCHLTGGGARANGIANMVPDSYLWDYSRGRMYIKITGGLADSPLQISTTNFGMRPSVGGTSRAGLVIDGIIVEGCSIHGILPGANPDAIIRNSVVRWIGGARNNNAGFYYGNGIEYGYGCDGLKIDNCEVYGCYDTGVSPQLYASPTTVMNGFQILNKTRISECGLAAIEVSTQGGGGIIRNGVIDDVDVFNNGVNRSYWADSTNNQGYGIDFRGQGTAGSYVTDCRVTRTRIRNCNGGMAVVNRTSAADATRIELGNVLMVDVGGGLECYAESGSAGLTVNWKGGVSARNARVVTTAGFASGGTGVNLKNVGIFDNAIVVQRSTTGLTATLRNCPMQGNAAIGSGTSGSLTGGFNALRRNTAGSYPGGANDVALSADIEFDDTVWYMPKVGSAIFNLAGEAQSPAYSDYFGIAFASKNWPRAPYAQHTAIAGGGSLPSSLIVARLGDSIMRGSDASGGLNEATYVSPWGYMVSALQAAGISITNIGVSSVYLDQPTRNGNATATKCAARGAATLREDQASPATNSVEQNIIYLAADNPGVTLDVALLDVGTNDLDNGIDATGALLPAKIAATIAQLRAQWPNIKIVAGIIPATYSKAKAQAGLDWLAGWHNGTTNFAVDFYSIGYDATSDTIDGTHPNNGGAQKLAGAFTAGLLASFSTGSGGGSGGSGGGSGGGGTTTTPAVVALLNTPAPALNNATGVAATNYSVGTRPAGTLILTASAMRRGGAAGTVATTDTEANGYSSLNRLADVYGASNIRATINHAFKTGAGSLTVTDTMSDGGYSQYAGVALAFSNVDPVVGMVDSGTAAAADTDLTTGTLPITTAGANAKVGDLVVGMVAVAPSTGTNANFTCAGANVVPINADWDTYGIPTAALAWKIATVDGLQTLTFGYLAGAHVSAGVIKVFRANQIVTSAPVITTTSLPNGQVGVAWGAVFAATGVAPLSYSLDSGALPTSTGPINATTGAIPGSPSAAGTFTFTLKVVDGNGMSATREFTVTIAAAPPSATAPVISTSSLPEATAGAAYSAQIAFSNGGAAITSASISVPGLSISNAGAITGTAPAADDYTALIALTNSAGSGSVSLPFKVNAAPGTAIDHIAIVGSSAVMVADGAVQMVIVEAQTADNRPVADVTLTGSVPGGGLTIIGTNPVVTGADGQAVFVMRGTAVGSKALRVTWT